MHCVYVMTTTACVGEGEGEKESFSYGHAPCPHRGVLINNHRILFSDTCRNPHIYITHIRLILASVIERTVCVSDNCTEEGCGGRVVERQGGQINLINKLSVGHFS